jgi:hypothetical protein
VLLRLFLSIHGDPPDIPFTDFPVIFPSFSLACVDCLTSVLDSWLAAAACSRPCGPAECGVGGISSNPLPHTLPTTRFHFCHHTTHTLLIMIVQHILARRWASCFLFSLLVYRILGSTGAIADPLAWWRNVAGLPWGRGRFETRTACRSGAPHPVHSSIIFMKNTFFLYSFLSLRLLLSFGPGASSDKISLEQAKRALHGKWLHIQGDSTSRQLWADAPRSFFLPVPADYCLVFISVGHFFHGMFAPPHSSSFSHGFEQHFAIATFPSIGLQGRQPSIP